MLPLYRSPWFTFHFAEDRVVPRFHLEGITPGREVAVYRADGVTGDPGELLATGRVGVEGWVDLAEPIVVRAGDTFLVIPADEPKV